VLFKSSVLIEKFLIPSEYNLFTRGVTSTDAKVASSITSGNPRIFSASIYYVSIPPTSAVNPSNPFLRTVPAGNA